MTYATLTSLNAQFGEREVIALADRDLDGVPDTVVLDDALATADNLIDSYIGRRYTVPLTDPPKLISTIAGTLVRYNLSGAGVSETDPARNRYRDAIKLLESIRDGQISIGPDPQGDPAPQATAIRVTGGNRKFSADTLDGDYL